LIADPSQIPETLAAKALPQTPHELPLDRGKIDALVDRVRAGEKVDLLSELLQIVDWSEFVTRDGDPISEDALTDLR
jgi:hypothetical protein